MLLLISNNPIFDKWLDAADLRSSPRSNKLTPAKSAADWFNLPEAHDEHDRNGKLFAPQTETRD